MRHAFRTLTIGAITLASVLAGSISPLAYTRHAAAASQVTLTVTYSYPFTDPTLKTQSSQSALKYTNAIVKAFEQAHPGVTIKFLNWGWSDTLRQKFLLNVAAGNAPDVITGETDFPEYARDGILLPVNLGSLQSQMVAGALSVGMYNGVAYAVPVQTGIFELYYNKALFTKAGLDPNKPPTTWDEWLTDSQKIHALGNGVSGTAVQSTTGLGATFRLAPFLRQLGGDFTAKDGVTPTIDTPANLKALTFLRQLAATQSPALAATTDEGKFYTDGWYAGKAGFTVNGGWDLPSCKTYHLDCGVTFLPIPTGGHAGNVVVGNMMFGVPKLAQHKDLALAFVNYIASAEASALNWQYNGELPANTVELAKVIADPTTSAMQLPFLKGLQQGQISGLPVFPENNANCYSSIYDLQSGLFTTQQPVASLIKKAQSDIEAQLAQ